MNGLLKVHLGMGQFQDVYRLPVFLPLRLEGKLRCPFLYVLLQVEIKDMNVHKGFNKSFAAGEQYSTDDYKASETIGKLF